MPPILKVADRLADLAGSPACANCPQRYCAHESLCNTYEAIDFPGYAEHILSTCDKMLPGIPWSLDCRTCFELLRAGALQQLGRIDEAEAIYERLATGEEDANQMVLVNLYRASIAEARGDVEAMSIALRNAFAHRGDGNQVNTDNEWFLLEITVRHAVLAGELGRAEQIFMEVPESVPWDCAEYIRAGLVLSRALAAAGNHEGASQYAELVARPAFQRGLMRYAAEAALQVAEACRELGNDAKQSHFASLLKNALGQIRSRDLDDRARAVGAKC
jgi:tetratricopeptide (TPR) repeat protein